jgi:hypothetical protein
LAKVQIVFVVKLLHGFLIKKFTCLRAGEFLKAAIIVKKVAILF